MKGSADLEEIVADDEQ